MSIGESEPLAGRGVPSPSEGEAGRPPRDPFRSLLNLARHGQVVRYRGGSEPAYLVNHPDVIKRVLVDNHANYTKGTLVNTIFKVAVADGLLTSEGEQWRRQRRLMQPAFQRERLAHLGEGMTGAAVALLDRCEELAGQGEPVDVGEEMGSLTLRIAAEALFGADIGKESDELGREIAMGLKGLMAPQKPQFQEGKARLEEVVLDIVEDRRRTGRPSQDLLSRLLEARDEETGLGMSDEQLRDQMITLLLAGHETTANALGWTWYLLAAHPEAVKPLHEELRSVLGGRPPSVVDLPALRYTRMVIDESLRLFPPAWVMGRRAVEGDLLGGQEIPAGSVLALCPYTVHRDSQFWETPERFHPPRFTSDRAAARKPFTYFPFGGGPRLCIGHTFALMETQLIVATIAQRFRLELVEGRPVMPERLFVLRPRGGLFMTLHRRTA